MKYSLLMLGTLMACQVSLHADIVDFNQPSDLALFQTGDTNFSPAPLTYGATAGIDGSGAAQVIADRANSSTYQNASFDLSEPGDTISVSALFKIASPVLSPQTNVTLGEVGIVPNQNGG